MTSAHPIIDLHQDILVHLRHKERFGQSHQTGFADLEETGTKIVLASAFPVPDDMNFLDPLTNRLIEEDFLYYADHTKKYPHWSLVRNRDDLVSVMGNASKYGLVLHVEGLNAFEDTPDHWSMLDRWHQMGWRSLGIVWNLKNSLGGGTKDDTSGLTELGKRVLAWAEERSILIDFAHMNEATFWDVARLVKRPILVSHGNSHTCCPSPRNYTDGQLAAIAESGGVIGVFFSKKFVTHEDAAEIAHVIAHINHIRATIGIDHIALGTDFGGITTGTVSNLAEVSDIPNLWSALRTEGYSDEDIAKISYKNSLRVLATLLPQT